MVDQDGSTLGAPDEVDEGGAELVAIEDRQRVVGPRLCECGQLDRLDAIPRSGRVGGVDDGGIGLPEGDPHQRGADARLVRGRAHAGARSSQGRSCVATGRDLGATQDHDELLSLEVGELLDPVRVPGRGDEDEGAVGEERGLACDASALEGALHAPAVGAGEDLRGRALGQLQDEPGGSGGVELEATPGPAGLEARTEVHEGLLE